MLRINIHEAKTHLSRYVQQVERGETILLCRRNKVVAEIKPVSAPKDRRAIGLAKGQFEVPNEFFEELPEELINAFDGE